MLLTIVMDVLNAIIERASEDVLQQPLAHCQLWHRVSVTRLMAPPQPRPRSGARPCPAPTATAAAVRCLLPLEGIRKIEIEIEIN